MWQARVVGLRSVERWATGLERQFKIGRLKIKIDDNRSLEYRCRLKIVPGDRGLWYGSAASLRPCAFLLVLPGARGAGALQNGLDCLHLVFCDHMLGRIVHCLLFGKSNAARSCCA